MEFTSPNKNSNGSTTVSINTDVPLTIEYEITEYGNHTTPPLDSLTFKKYLGEIAILYESYSKKWFTRPIMPTLFLSRLIHNWDTGTHQPYTGRTTTIVSQEWCPEQIIVNFQNFTINWKLQSVEYKNPRFASISGPVEITSEDIPHDSVVDTLSLETTLRSRALRKVRQARVVYAVSKARADALTVRYYEKYGNLEELDSNSVLSSDSE
jgi:hypothetical protein